MKNVLAMFVVFGLFVGGCASTSTNDNKATTDDSSVAIANPASENCVAVGGDIVLTDVEIDGEKFGQYGVCEFEDNMQCEEWALMNGDCPEGGVKITGYVSKASIFCAITGGEYAMTSLSGESFEQGTCTGKTGVECEVWDYYRGACSIK